jgi:hypothetical protein
MGTLYNGLKREWLRLTAENARLRVVLQSLTEDPPATLDEPDEDWEVIMKMRKIARDALDHDLPTAADVRGILSVDQ